jgi:hypothetical protein
LNGLSKFEDAVKIGLLASDIPILDEHGQENASEPASSHSFCKSMTYRQKAVLFTFSSNHASESMEENCRRYTMSNGFPALICFAGSIVFFAFAIRMRRFRVPEKPPASRAHLSLEERQKKIKIASWLSFAMGLLMLGAALFFEFSGAISLTSN